MRTRKYVYALISQIVLRQLPFLLGVMGASNKITSGNWAVWQSLLKQWSATRTMKRPAEDGRAGEGSGEVELRGAHKP